MKYHDISNLEQCIFEPGTFRLQATAEPIDPAGPVIFMNVTLKGQGVCGSVGMPNP